MNEAGARQVETWRAPVCDVGAPPGGWSAGGAARLVQQCAVGAEAEAFGGGCGIDLTFGEFAPERGGWARDGDGGLAGGVLVGVVSSVRRGGRGCDGGGGRGFDGSQGDTRPQRRCVRGQEGFAVEVFGQVVKHGACLFDDGGVFGVEAVDEPADEGDLAHELGACEDV